jgi:ATP-binding cassette, subfamily B, bacterial
MSAALTGKPIQTGSSGHWDWATHFLPLLHPLRNRILWASFAMVLDAALTLCRPWPLKIVIDRVIAPVPHPTRVPVIGGWLSRASLDPMHILYWACAATMLISLGTGALTYGYTRAMGSVGQSFVFAIRRNLFAHMQRLSLRFHDRERSGDLITRLTTDIQSIQELIANGVIILISNGVLLSGMLMLMFWLNWRFALAALSVSPLLFCTVFLFTRRVKIATRVARTNDGLLASIAQETLAAIRIVQGLAQEGQQNERFDTFNLNSLHAYLEGIRYQARVAPLVDLLAATGLAMVMWYGATRARAGALTIGDVVVFFAYVTNLYSPMKALAKLSYAYNKAIIGAERIVDVMRLKCEVTDCKAARPAPQFAGKIEFRNISFEYDSGRPVLSRLNLCVQPGERLAIVGTTGAGKSTLVSLIPRLYDPSGGAVLIDDHDLREYQIDSVRDQISLVLQDSLLFSGTIRDNIAFGRPNATESEIIGAAVTANAAEFIGKMPDGYDTQVSERGTSLSGGQKQRIAIARAILRAAPILILDEPTSGLDMASEHIVVEALERAASGRTTLTIAHRLSTVRFASRIVVLDRGQIVEQGTPAELRSNGGKYSHLYNLHLAPHD